MRQAIYVLSLFLSFAFTNSCIGIGDCKNYVAEQIMSPDGRVKAVLYNRGCGATVGFITGVSILPADQQLSDDDKANVLLAEGAVQKYSREDNGNIVNGDMNFFVDWKSNSELLISYPEAETYTKKDHFGDVKVIYKVIGNKNEHRTTP